MFEAKVVTDFNYPVVRLYDTTSDCEIEIFSHGALLNKFIVILDDVQHNMIQGYSSVSDATDNLLKSFASARLSPFTCRLKNGKYTFQDKEYTIEKNYLGKHAIHGIVYDSVYDIAETGGDAESAWAVLTNEYDGSDEGYPFAFTSQIKYTLFANNTLQIASSVKHNNAFSIPYAEGWHPYFTMDETIDNCTLQIDSNKKIETDSEIIPTGKILADNTFEAGKLLSNVKLDDCFVLKNEISVIKLTSEKLELTIAPDEHYPFVQIFTPDGRKSIAIENLTAPPDCFNNKINLLMMEPDKEYSFSTAYSVKLKV